MTCKDDCVHTPVCRLPFNKSKMKLNCVEVCHHFKNKADFVEVKHGKWESYMPKLVYDCYVYHKCSICGASNPWEHTSKGLPPFCVECGAKMDGERRCSG